MPILHIEYDRDDRPYRVILPVRAQTGSYVRRRRARRPHPVYARPAHGFRGALADAFFGAHPEADDAAFVAWCRDGCPALPGR